MKLFTFSPLLVLAFAGISQASVIYGADTRVELSGLKDPRLVQLAQSVPALVNSDDLAEIDGISESVHQRMGFCSDERFATESSFASCSGVLIGPNQVLTASHCVLSPGACAKTKVIFGYVNSLPLGKAGMDAFAPENVYQCRRVRTSENCSFGACDPDLAIVELDRPVTGRAPVAVQTQSPDSEMGAKLVSAGYTLGMPLKFDLDGKVLKDTGTPVFQAALDIGPGNSGGPVFELGSGRLVGLTIEGPAEPFSSHAGTYDAKASCFRSIHCSMNGCENDGDVQVQRVDADELAALETIAK